MKNLYPRTASCCLKLFAILLLFISVEANAQESMRANLYVVDASGTTLVDGNLTNYNDIYSNAVDIDDAWKMTNPGINFGILRDGNTLVVERRSIIGNADTTFFRMWNMPQLNYRIRLVLKNLNHPGLKGSIKDNYLNTEYPIGLNDTTYYNFTVDANPASANQNRFQVIFGINSFVPVDVNFTGIQLQRQGNDALVEWTVSNEVSMELYTIEHSVDGRNFNSLQQVNPVNTQVAKTYTYKHLNIPAAENFYRIKAVSSGGRIQYSPIAKLCTVNAAKDITVYPNPVVNKTVQLQFNKQAAGKYNISLIYSNGVRQSLLSMQLGIGQESRSVKLPQSLAAGTYRLQFVGADNKAIIKTIQVL